MPRSRKPYFDPGRVDPYWDQTETYIRERLDRIYDASGYAAYLLMRAAFVQFEALANQLAREQGIDAPKRDAAGQVWRRSLIDQAAPIWRRLQNDLAASALRYATAAYVFSYLARGWQLAGASLDPVDLAPLDPRLVMLDIAQHVVAREDPYDDLILTLLGQEWRDQFQGEVDALVSNIKNTILQGMDAGEGMPTLMRRVADTIGVSTDRRNPDNRGNYARVQAITETTAARVANDASLRVYVQAGVEEYQILTARDEKVCPRCAPLDGRVVSVENPELNPPFHVRCRCGHIPIVPRPKEQAAAPGGFTQWAKNLGYNVVRFMKGLGIRI